MSKLISSIEHITRSKACRVQFNPWGSHQFGGKPDIDYSGYKLPRPLHHFFSLDTFDRNSPLRFEGIRYVPLVYPLAYSGSEGYISYQVIGEGKIKILDISEHRPEAPPYFLLDALPERKAELLPLTYAEKRILGSDVLERSMMDRWRMHRLWNGECFRVSGILEYRPRLSSSPCPALKNTDGRLCDGWIFAYFPASKKPFGNIWYDYSADVYFNFATCVDCGTIYAFDECT